jgi:hypothetical protein
MLLLLLLLLLLVEALLRARQADVSLAQPI